MESTERDAPSSVRARHAAARVAPDEGTWQAPYREPRGSAPRERDHRGGDHPVPSRTRQLSPPSPRVLQREAAGGQGVALAEGAFLMRARRMRRERPAGEVPPAGLSAPCRGRGFAGGPIGVAAHTAPARHRGAGRYRRGGRPLRASPRSGEHCPAGRSDEGVFPRPGGSADGGACATSADRGAGGPPGGASLPGGPSFGRCAPARFCAVCAPCKSALVLPMAFSARWVGRRPAFFRYAPLPDSDFCWSLKALMWTIISKLYTVHWRNAGVGDCASR